MKKLVSLLLIITLTLSLFTFNIKAAEENVIFYEDFENGLENWTLPADTESKFTITAEDKKSGKSSLKVIDDMKAATSTNYHSKHFDVIPGYEYTITADIKIKEGQADAGLVYLRFNTADNKPALSESVRGSGNEWITKKGTFVAPENSAKIFVIISSISSATGVVYIDNIKITAKKAEAKVDANGANIVFADDFEYGVDNWTIPAGMEAKFSTTTEDKKDGNSSLKIIDDMNASSSTNYYSRRFPAKPGHQYTLSADIKVADGKADAGLVYIRFNTADGKPALSESLRGTGNSWSARKGTYIAPDDAAFVLVIIASGSTATGTVYVDNIKITEKEASGELTEDLNSTSAADFKTKFNSSALMGLTAGTVVNHGSHIKDIQIIGNYVDEKTNMFYAVTSGTPAIFFSYNLDTGKVEDTKELRIDPKDDKSKVSYGVDMGKDGIINITTQSTNALFFRYNTKTKEMKCYGNIFGETAVMSRGYTDEEGNYYFGTYPSAKLLKYDIKQDKLVDLGNVIGGHYARAIGGYKDKIFIGSQGAPVAEFVKYDIKTGKTTSIPNPSLEGVFEGKDVENFYTSFYYGKYYFGKCKIVNEKITAYYVCVLDMETEKWVGYVDSPKHLHFTNPDNGIMYFHKAPDRSNLNVAGLFSYNPETNETKHIEGLDSTTINSYFVSPKVCTLKDQEKYPGKTIVAGSDSNGIMLVNLENKKVEFIKDVLPQQTTPIRILKKGMGDDIVISAYMGAKFVVYDIKTNKVKYEAPSTQAESIRAIDGKYYLGLYGSNAGLREFDPSKPISADNPKIVAEMKGAEQGRAFNIADAGDKIVWGSFPDYGKIGGAVSVYDKATGKVDIYKEPIKNQCIAGLTYKDGKIYGSTSVYCGLGADPIDAPAQIFIMDLKTGKVEKAVEVILKTDEDRQYYVGDMTFDNDGNLWVACVKTILKVNPETLAIEKEIPIGSGTLSLSTTKGPCYVVEIGNDDLLYTNVGGRISAVDTKTCEAKVLAKTFTNSITVGSDGNIYYMNHQKSDEMHMLPLTRAVDPKAQEILKKSMVMFIGSPNAIVNGEKTLIDKENDKVIADTVDGRTLVPVRFIAENYGAEVGWDDPTQTVTLKLKDKTVTIVLNKNEIDIDGKKITIDVPAKTFQDRTMLPLRAFVEQVMGKTIFWDDRGLIVITDSPMLDANNDRDAINSIITAVK